MTKTRRLAKDDGVLKADWQIWEFIHWLTMTLFKRHIIRGYSQDTGKLSVVYWDNAANWNDEGEDWHRLKVPYPEPIWRRK